MVPRNFTFFARGSGSTLEHARFFLRKFLRIIRQDGIG